MALSNLIEGYKKFYDQYFARDSVYAINTGQMLSIPFVLVGIYLIFRAVQNKSITSEN
jgi:prolipoprotein diacylglyceryltransferase